jgi:hypothetical protein
MYLIAKTLSPRVFNLKKSINMSVSSKSSDNIFSFEL